MLGMVTGIGWDGKDSRGAGPLSGDVRWRHERVVSQNANMPFLPNPFDGDALKAGVRAILAAPVQPASHLQTSDPPK